MGLLDNRRVKKAMDTLVASRSSTGSDVVQAIDKLKQVGPTTVPKLIEALSLSRNRENIVAVLVAMVNGETLPTFINSLDNASPPRVIAGVVDTLSRSNKYDPNRLLSLFTNSRVSRENLEKILVAQRERLRPDPLLRLLNVVSKDERNVIMRLISQVANEEMVPEFIQHLRTEDWTIRLHLTRVLSRFKTEAVRDVLTRLLEDPHMEIRMAALEGLIALRMPFDVGPLCQLLREPDAMLRAKAVEVLLECLQDGTEEVRRKTVEGLGAVGDTQTLKEFLGTLKDQDWWVTVRVADAFGAYGGTKIVGTVLTLLKEEDSFIRQCAFEILHTVKDEQAFGSLVRALKDKEIRERAVDALTALGDKRAVPVFVSMLEGDDAEATFIAIRALVALGDPQAIHPLLVQFDNPDEEVRREALRAVAVLTDEGYAQDVLHAVMSVRDNSTGEVKVLANKMATSIIKRFGAKVMPQRSLKNVSDTEETHEAETHEAETPVSHTPSRADNGTKKNEESMDVTNLEAGVVLVDRYRVVRRVGQGGFSTVFLVEDTVVHEEVILKILDPKIALDDGMIKRFIHELRYARKVTHENVVRIYDFITLGSGYAISMEYFLSHNLADELRDGKPLNVNRGVKIVWEICRGIGAAHQADVVHRDMKPPNILIDDNRVVKIVDFGVAAVTSDMSTRLTRIGTVLGTPTYMAPEQVRSRTIDARTDIYSLGVIMYEMFTGKPPYIGEDMAVLFQHVEGNPVLPRQVNPELAPELEAIILKAMAVDPEQRFQSSEELRKSLVEFARQKR